MSGDPDPLYVQARSALLDATDALADHLNAIVLVGAQAVYLHTGDADIAVAEYTTDADFAIGPDDLADAPLLTDLLAKSGFTARVHPGGWLSPHGIYVDLMVPEALAGSGRRGARLGAHGKRVARRAKGLEATLVDTQVMTIPSLDPTDERSVTMKVAGPAALLVAKIHKISERSTQASDRLRDKDALDVLRLLQATDSAELANSLTLLADDTLSHAVTTEAMAFVPALFGDANSVGVKMAVRATGLGADPAVISASLTSLVDDFVALL